MASIKCTKQPGDKQEDEKQNIEIKSNEPHLIKEGDQGDSSRCSPRLLIRTSQIFNTLKGLNITQFPQRFKKILTWSIWVIILLLTLRAIIFESSPTTQEASSDSSATIAKSERIITNLLQFQARIKPLLENYNETTNKTSPE